MARWRPLLWPAGIVATLLVLFGGALGPSRTLAFRDTDRLYAPMRTLVDEALRSARLPLWNPHECLGKPLFAEGIHGVLHPVSVAGAWVARGDVDFLAVAYLIAAALGAFTLARTLGASSAASAGAGLGFGLSGYVVSMTGNLVFLAGAASFPWAIAAARAAGLGAPFGPFAVALATAASFFSGDTQMTLVALVMGVALAWAAGGRRGAARALVGVAAGLLLASVQILASGAALQQTSRGLALGPGDAEQWPLMPARIFEWILPGLVGGRPGALSRVPEIIRAGNIAGSFAESIYLGAPILLLAAVGLWSARAAPSTRRTAWVLLAALGLLIWIALGHHLGARQLLDHVPIWSRFRYSEKLMAPIALCMAVAAALGIDRAGEDRLPRAAVLGALGAAALAAMALAAVLLAPGPLRRLFSALDDAAARLLLENLRRALLHPLLALAALLVADRARASARTALFTVAATGALAAAVPYGTHLGDQAAHALASPLRLEAAPPGPRIAHPVEGLLAPTETLDALDVQTLLRRILLVPAVNVASRVDEMDCYGAFRSTRRAAFRADVGGWMMRAARRFGLTHVVLTPPGDESEEALSSASIAGGRLAESLDDPPIEVWAVPHRPWAAFADRVIPVPGMAAARPIVAELAVRGDHQTVVVEATEPPPTSPGRVLAVFRDTEELRIDAEATGPGLLVVNDAFWPGWRAFIDGRETEILPADLLVRAVRWPAGRHTMIMTYDPPELRVGLALTGLGALATAVLAALPLLPTLRRRLGGAAT